VEPLSYLIAIIGFRGSRGAVVLRRRHRQQIVGHGRPVLRARRRRRRTQYGARAILPPGPKTCSVRSIDARGASPMVALSTSSLYEPSAAALHVFRKRGWWSSSRALR
jgi:hypothetical protein